MNHTMAHHERMPFLGSSFNVPPSGLGWEANNRQSAIQQHNFRGETDISAVPKAKSQRRQERGVEVCKIDGISCELPSEIFDLPDLSDILCLETWNDVLSDDDREHLAQFLPLVDGEDLQEALQDLLGGFNVNFGNPRDSLWNRLSSGLCNPRVTNFREGFVILQRKQHYHRLRSYHNKMVNKLLEMKKLWRDLPPGSQLDQKLKHWNYVSNGSLLSKNITPVNGKPAQVNSFKSPNGVIDQKQAKQRLKGSRLKDSSDSATKIKNEVTNVPLDSSPVTGPALKRKRNSEEEQLRVVKHDSRLESERGLADNQQQGGKNSSAMATSSPASQSQSQSKNLATKSTKSSSSSPSPLAAEVKTEGKGGGGGGGGGASAGTNKNVLSLPLPLLGPADAVVGFSVIHVLSAVRSAMLQTYQGSDDQEWLLFTEILERVRQMPGDPRLLDGKQVLAEVVRQALTVLQTRAPPGTRLWKPFVQQRRQYKEWSWCGPVPPSSHGGGEKSVRTDYEAWGVTEKALTKLQERFLEIVANGPPPNISYSEGGAGGGGGTVSESTEKKGTTINNGTSASKGVKEGSKHNSMVWEQLKKEPPSERSPTPSRENEKASKDSEKGGIIGNQPFQKSQVTLPDRTPQMKELFREEERVRFQYPQRAFHYTAVDGGRSIVAPIKRVNSKSLGKARDHAMLQPSRPSHVTILCLVRDAAARLPNAIGTRADVCSLVKDSQYFVEDTPDSQVNQIVSGAMDRLHYERDPCIKFDVEKKLWVYLHRDRGPGDFGADGTMSTRNWGKRKSLNTADEEREEVAVSAPESPSDEPLAKRQVSDVKTPPITEEVETELDKEPSGDSGRGDQQKQGLDHDFLGASEGGWQEGDSVRGSGGEGGENEQIRYRQNDENLQGQAGSSKSQNNLFSQPERPGFNSEQGSFNYLVERHILPVPGAVPRDFFAQPNVQQWGGQMGGQSQQVPWLLNPDQSRNIPYPPQFQQVFGGNSGGNDYGTDGSGLPTGGAS